jgi:hypothetical protein
MNKLDCEVGHPVFARGDLGLDGSNSKKEGRRYAGKCEAGGEQKVQ